MNETRSETKPAAGTTARESFGGTELATIGETAITAAAAQARAAVEARYVMAMRRPRDLMAARTRLLADCARPSFAKAAIYRRPIGVGVEGPSIRFAEAAMRALTNLDVDVQTIYDDPERRIVRATATDLEVNATHRMDVTIEKTVERSKIPQGETPLRTRTNSRGEPVHLLRATEDEMLGKERALISKAIRTLILRLVPGDLVDDALAAIRATRLNRTAEDPQRAKKEAADAYAAIGVTPASLAEFLGHPLDSSSPDELAELEGIYCAIRDKETTWAATLAGRLDERNVKTVDAPASPGAAQAPASSAPRAKTADELRAEARAKTQGPKL